jgi:hypothetical protein
VHLIGHAAGAADIERIDGVWHHRVNIFDRAICGLRGSPVAMELYAAAAKHQEVAKLHASEPVDLVVAAIWPGEGLVCLLDDRLTTVTVLVTPVKLMVDRGWLSGEQYVALGRMEEAVLKRSRHIHSSTAAITAEVEATFGVGLPRHENVPLFVCDRTGRRALERYASPDQVEVLFVGRPEPRKGADVLVAAATSLEPEFPDAQFVLVGEGDWSAVRPRDGTDPWAREHLSFLGRVDEARLWRLYSGADIVCVPSRYESFGYALIEAMMFGKPIVATNVGGMSSTVVEGENAWLCPPGDPDALARSLSRLMRDPEMRAAFGRRSRELYVGGYSEVPGGARTAALYASIAAERRDGGVGASLVDQLAEAIREIAQPDTGLASQIAAELLNGSVTHSNSWKLTQRLRNLRRRGRGDPRGG